MSLLLVAAIDAAHAPAPDGVCWQRISEDVRDFANNATVLAETCFTSVLQAPVTLYWMLCDMALWCPGMAHILVWAVWPHYSHHQVCSFSGVLCSISPPLFAVLVVYCLCGTIITTAVFGPAMVHLQALILLEWNALQLQECQL